VDDFDPADGFLAEGRDQGAHPNQTVSAKKLPRLTELPGERLIKWLVWCLIALSLAFGAILTTAHVLARTTDMPSAQILVARLYTDDLWWHPTDRIFAKQLLHKAIAAGDIKAQYRLARDYENEKNYAQAFPLHEDLALKGWTDSQTRLGMLYMEGHGVSQNTDVATLWLKKAAAQGDASAHLLLGVIYFGELPNSPQDIVQAAQWIHSSAQLGNGRAQDTLARLYTTGKGVPENLDIAMQWANSSLDAGYGPASETIQLIQSLKKEKGKRNGS